MRNLIPAVAASLSIAFSLATSQPARADEPARTDAKPIVAIVEADWCPFCVFVRPAIQEVAQGFGNRVQLVRFDVTDGKRKDASMVMAKQIGLEGFFSQNQGRTSTVAVFLPHATEPMQTFWGFPNRDAYKASIERALGK